MPTTTSVPSPLPTLYSVAETARLLKVNPRTVRRWIEKGDLTIHRLGRQIRITDSDLVTFLRQRRE